MFVATCCMVHQASTGVYSLQPHYTGAITMSKTQKSNKENKKAPAMTQKEKKAAKKSKQDAKRSPIGLFD